MNIKGCIGCNNCWLVTPGVCTIKDAYEELLMKFLSKNRTAKTHLHKDHFRQSESKKKKKISCFFAPVFVKCCYGRSKANEFKAERTLIFESGCDIISATNQKIYTSLGEHILNSFPSRSGQAVKAYERGDAI